MSRLLGIGAAALTVIVLTLFSVAVQADARIAWVGAWGGPLTVADDDGVGGRVVVAPSVTGFELAPRGDAIVYRAAGGPAWLLVFGRPPVRLPARTLDEGDVAWSPDGRELAILRRGANGGAELLVVDRRGRTRLAVDLGWSRSPEGVAWRMDGRRLAAVRTGVPGVTRSHPSQVVTLDRDGGGRRRLYTAGEGHQLAYGALWTRDGVVTMAGDIDDSSAGGVIEFYLPILVGRPGPPRDLDADRGGDPRSLSPGGRRFALKGQCVYDLRDGCLPGTGRGEVSVMDLSPDGGRALVVAGGALRVLALEPGAPSYPLAIGEPIADAQWSAG